MTDFTPSTVTGLNTVRQTATVEKTTAFPGLPKKQGLYDPANEHDACGVGFVAHMKGQKSHQIVKDGLFILENLTHRGAVGADPLMGDGAGILVQIPTVSSVKKWPCRASSCRRPVNTLSATCSCRRTRLRIAHFKQVISEVAGRGRPDVARVP